MAPEEKAGGLIMPKLDVFAFGVILLEIMSGKEAVSFCQIADQTGPNTLKKTLLPDVISSILEGKKPGRRLRVQMNPLLGDSAPLGYSLKIPFCNRMNDKIHACLPSIPCQDNHNYTLRSNLPKRKDGIMGGCQCQ
jgi:hypothetical protein